MTFSHNPNPNHTLSKPTQKPSLNQSQTLVLNPKRTLNPLVLTRHGDGLAMRAPQKERRQLSARRHDLPGPSLFKGLKLKPTYSQSSDQEID